MRDSHLHRLHDAIHGSIDYVGFGSGNFTAAVESVLSSEFMRRLKHVKQLGFVSENYISASHDRYTHSIGTMVMMRSLLDRLRQQGALDRPECPMLGHAIKAFPKAFDGLSATDSLIALEDHLLLAALSQDIGELPYNIATSGLFEPHHLLSDEVAKALGISTAGLEAKTVFSLAAIRSLAKLSTFKPFHLPLFTFLISGRLSGGKELTAGLAALRQMMDGSVDADRLDYVHRDALHALGIRRDPEAVVASLCYFDSQGPVFSDVGPVADFFATRATLWSSIYLHPSNRFRTVLLSIVLRDVILQRNRGTLPGEFGLSQGGVTLEEFMLLDDLYVDNLLKRLLDRNQFSFDTTKAKRAAEILLSDGPEYKYYWVDRKSEEAVQRPLIQGNMLPDDLFWDAYLDYQSHRLYELGTVRVLVDHYKYIQELMPLEDCSGPFNVMLKDQVSGLPMPGLVTVFRPMESETEVSELWDTVEEMTENGALYDTVQSASTINGLQVDFDTRDVPGFSGKTLFISFATQDIKIVSNICSELYKKKQKYFCLADPFEGIGGTPRDNSVAAVQSADAVLLLFSPAYADRYRTSPDGNLAAEVLAMMKRKQLDSSFPILPLSTVSFAEMQEGLPWRELGFENGQVPMVGPPLQGVHADVVRRAIEALPLQ